MCNVRPAARLELEEKFSSHWRIHFVPERNQESVLQGQIGWEVSASPGECVVASKYMLHCISGRLTIAACGDVAFTKAVRDIVAKHPRDTAFYELEYQPGKADTSTSRDEFRFPRRHLTRLPKPKPAAISESSKSDEQLASYWNQDSAGTVPNPRREVLRDARRQVKLIRQQRTANEIVL